MSLHDTIPPEQSAIRVEGVHKAFGDLVVFEGVDLQVARGLTTSIIGPSGTGKSVLLKHIVGLLRPDRGHVWVGDTDMAVATEAQAYAVRRRLGMLFQQGALFDSFTAGENVAFPLVHHTRLSPAERRERAEAALAMVELEGLHDRPTPELSGGQRKRVGLARAIVMEPELILFDEPNSGLDPLTSDTIDDLIRDLKERLGITFLVITHDIVQAANISDRVAMLWEGHVEASLPTEDFLRCDSEIVQAFLRRNLEVRPDGIHRRTLEGLRSR